MSDIVPSRSLYVSSVVYGYLIVFLVVVPVFGLLLGGEMSNAMGIFTFSLIIAIPITILAALIGFPVFRYISKQFKVDYLINILIAGICSAFVCAVILGIGAFVLAKGSITDIGFIMFLQIPTLGVSIISSLVYWWRTKQKLEKDY